MRIGTILWIALSAAACSSSNQPGEDAGVADMTVGEPLAITCSDDKGSVYTLPSGLPAFDPSHRGDVFRCSFEAHVSADDANGALTALGYTGAPVPFGATVYRIAFRTERSSSSSSGADGGAEPVEGYSSAQVLIPDAPRPEAFVVTAHGTLGLASSCADSLKDILDPTYTQTSKILDLAFAGNGWVVIEPDLSGYGYNQAPSGWYLAEDEAYTILDATRAMKNVLGAALPPQVAFVGHSQGSHVVLAAQSFAKSYGMEGRLIGVAPMSLLWFSAKSWGASITSLANLTTMNDAAAISYGMYYFYGHGELYDGTGGGLTMFQAGKQSMVKSIVETTCESDTTTTIPTLGSTPADFYDSTFIDAMENCMILQQGCDQEPAATWLRRAYADRPPIDPDSAPIVIWHGGKDTDISPARAQCGFDKIQQDLMTATNPTTTLTICGDADADHSGVAQRDTDWVQQWIGARATGQPDPPGCPGAAPLNPPGGTLTCSTPPSNE